MSKVQGSSLSVMSRRQLLGGAAALGGLTTAALALPPNVRKALAAPSRGSFDLRGVKHVVLIMQENRSFDHYFGTLPGVRGFSDPNAITLSTGRSVFFQPDSTSPDGYRLPYHLDTLSASGQNIPSTSHAWATQHDAWNDGLNDNWLPAHLAADGATNGLYTMGYYERQDIPFHWALAEHFTIFDNYHCSVFGPTNPNRLMWLTGTIDPDAQFGGPAIDNSLRNGQYSWPTYPEALTAAGVSWKFYQQTTTYNPLANHTRWFDADPSSTLYKNGVATIQPGQFEFDAIHGNLPAVSWVFPPSANSEHPSRGPAAGALFLSSIIDAVAANPEVWASTVIILNYDENDGLFDHVVPPTPPAGTANELVTATSPFGTPGNGLPVGPGFRVPLIIISPWTQGGWVCSDVSDHTSVLKFLEVFTGVPATNISAWRRATVSDLTGAFHGASYDAARPVLPEATAYANLATFNASLPLPTAPSIQTVPAQQPGNRPKHRG
ncbi:MAG: hypothetical protein FWD17_03865 [Polyangiaceae bacterium]|nr:hypothetical protein [Polyangiaceae bacterium]